MISYIEISNFLSWEKAHIPLGALTCVHGLNNSGKTSISRALAWCLLNDGVWSDDPIRDTIRRQLPDGSLANEVVVTVGFSDGRRVTRRRSAKPNINMYTMQHSDGTVDEIPSGSVGSGFCQSVGDFTGVKPTVWPDGKSKTFLQFSNDAIEGRFLLADGTTTIDSKLGVVIGVDVLETATKTAASIATAASRKAAEIEKALETKREALSAYETLDIAIAAHRRASDAVSASQAASSASAAANAASARIEQHAALLRKVGGIPEKLAALVDTAEAATNSARDHRRNALTAEALSVKMVVVEDDRLSRISVVLKEAETLVAAAEAKRKHAETVESIAKSGSQQAETHHRCREQLEALEEELGILLSDIHVCPVDGEPHQLCPYYEQTVNETV